MSLIGNGFRHNLTGKLFGATALDGANPTVHEYRGHRAASMRNITAGEGITDDKSGLPMGYVMKGWQLPQKAGMISARMHDFRITPTGNAVMGYPIEATASLTITIDDANGELISSGNGSATITITPNTPQLTASIGGIGEAAFTITVNTPTLGAEANVSGNGSLTITGTINPYAIGIMEGTTEEAGLTNAGIANSVWSKVIEAGFTADQILRIVAAHAAGSATGLEGANPQFTGLDGVTLRIDGSYLAGTRTIDSLDGE